jgi:large subunit ribosomal protein L4
MANLNTLDLKNKPSGQVEFNDQILATEYHPQAVKQAVIGYLAARRQGTHSTKTRAEVSYSTKKLYRQKGTGNARMGTNRSPLKRGGSVIFGPKPRIVRRKTNKQFSVDFTKQLLLSKVDHPLN